MAPWLARSAFTASLFTASPLLVSALLAAGSSRGMLRDLLSRELLADGGGARARVRDHRFSRFHRCGLLEVGSVADGSQVAELVTAGGSVFALTSCGVCVGFDAASGRRLCVLNRRGEREAIVSLVHNELNASLVVVSALSEDPTRPRCSPHTWRQLRRPQRGRRPSSGTRRPARGGSGLGGSRGGRRSAFFGRRPR